MNKLLIGLMGAVTMMASADAALLDMAQRKEACNNTDGFVWITNASGGQPACVAKYPCTTGGYDAYCNRMFKDIQVTGSEHAKSLMDTYLKKRSNAKCNRFDMDKAHLVGQDYIRCTLNDGGYMEFEFDDYSESVQSTGDYGYAKGMCLIYGGTPSGMSKERAIELAAAGALVSAAAVAGGVATLGVAAGASTVAGGIGLASVATGVSAVGTYGVASAVGDVIVALTNDTLLTCEGIKSATECNEMYNGMAAWLEDEHVCAPYKDFIY